MNWRKRLIVKYLAIIVVLSSLAPLSYLITGSLLFLILFNSFNFALNVAAMIAALDALKAAAPLHDLLVNKVLVDRKPSRWDTIRRALFKR